MARSLMQGRLVHFRVGDNGDVVLSLLGRMAGRAKAGAAALDDIGQHMVNTSIPANFAAQGRPDKWIGSDWTSEKIQTDSTQLLRSITPEVAGQTLRIGTNLAYARQRQLGGKIAAKAAKALPIPLPWVPKGMRRPRRWGDRLFRIKSKKGDPNTIGVLAIEERGDIKPVFVLRKSVTQPARPYLLWQDEDLVYAQRSIVEHLTAEVA